MAELQTTEQVVDSNSVLSHDSALCCPVRGLSYNRLLRRDPFPYYYKIDRSS